MTQLYSNAGFEQTLEIRKGATFKAEVVIADDSDTPMDITGWEFRATVASKTEPTTDKQDFEFGDANEGGTGVIIGTLDATKSGALIANDSRMAIARYRWNCDAKLPNGEIIPICYGDVIVKNTDVDWS